MPSRTVYISQANEAYWDDLPKGARSAHLNMWISQDREEAKMVKQHVVDEGVALGILHKPERHPSIKESPKFHLDVKAGKTDVTTIRPSSIRENFEPITKAFSARKRK